MHKALQYHSPLEGESARGRSPQSSRRGANAEPAVEPEGGKRGAPSSRRGANAAPRRAGGGQTPPLVSEYQPARAARITLHHVREHAFPLSTTHAPDSDSLHWVLFGTAAGAVPGGGSGALFGRASRQPGVRARRVEHHAARGDRGAAFSGPVAGRGLRGSATAAFCRLPGLRPAGAPGVLPGQKEGPSCWAVSSTWPSSWS